MSAALNVSEEPVLTLPDGCPPPNGITADGHVFGFWEQADKTIRFHWDGQVGEPFSAVFPTRDGTALFWSDDGCHVAYRGVRNGHGVVVRDGVESSPFDDLTNSVPPTFSAGGAHLAYGAKVGGDFRLIIDGAVAGTASLAPVAAVFSPDGTRLAFAEAQGEGSGSKYRLVVDGTPGEWDLGVRNAGGALQFSPDSRRFAYCQVDGRGSARWVVDGKAQRWFYESRSFNWDAMVRGVGVAERPLPATFSPDSRRFAYFADVKEKGVAVVEDDDSGPLLKAIRWPRFSPDSRHLAYAAQDLAKRWLAVRDGAAGVPRSAAAIGEVVFSPDSTRLAWTCRREEGLLRKRSYVSAIVDDAVLFEVEGEDSSLSPVFRIGSTDVAWWARHGNTTRVFIGDEAGPPLGEGSEPVSTASGRVVYSGAPSLGQTTVYVDHRPGPMAEFWLMNLLQMPTDDREGIGAVRLSPDGEHVAWAGIFGGTPRPVLDDSVGPAYDQVLGWSFAANGTATWFTLRGQTLYRTRSAG